jgi:hypothetical protein
MSTPEVNRRNAALSTGPRTEAGRLASSRNALTHGLTSKSPILPGENPEAFHAHAAAYLNLYNNPAQTDSDIPRTDSINELSGIRWRLARVPAVEADLIALEVRELISNPDHADTIAGLELRYIEAIAFKRLMESRILTNLYNQEARLSRRAVKIQQRLEANAVHSATTPATSQSVPQPDVQPLQSPESKRKNEPTPPANQPIKVVKIGRNETCPCGSGLKFKRCCLDRPANPLAAAA